MYLLLVIMATVLFFIFAQKKRKNKRTVRFDNHVLFCDTDELLSRLVYEKRSILNDVHKVFITNPSKVVT
jgi:hypothetical protein